MAVARNSRSYPYLAVAEAHKLNYGETLRCAELIRELLRECRSFPKHAVLELFDAVARQQRLIEK